MAKRWPTRWLCICSNDTRSGAAHRLPTEEVCLEIASRVLDYIGDNLSDDLSLSELAGVAGMSAHYFAELFRKSTGHSPHRYVLLQRIEHAKQSLCERGNSVIEAALAAGFENPSHFARVFRKFVGTSPSRFQFEMAGLIGRSSRER
jgi:AraC-like DNA-binding protein